jgi:hypothetical protein
MFWNLETHDLFWAHSFFKTKNKNFFKTKNNRWSGMDNVTSYKEGEVHKFIRVQCYT